MERIIEAIEARNYNVLVSTCEELDFEEASSFGSSNINMQEIYPILIAGYLIQNDLNSARFLYKRIPPQIKSNSPEIQATWNVGSAMWQRQYPAIYQSINEYQWSPIMKQLVIQLAELIRSRTFTLIADAYSSITVQSAAEYMGMPPEQIISVAIEHGWTHDTSNQILNPVKIEPPPEKPMELNDFSTVADVVVHLEKA